MSERTRKAATEQATVMDAPGGAGAAPDFGRAAGAFLNGWTSIGGQLLGLAQNSLQAGLEAAEELRQCRSPQDLLDAQIRHAQRACAAYMDGAREVSTLITRTSTETMDAIGMRRA
jgi:hypothetical protein